MTQVVLMPVGLFEKKHNEVYFLEQPLEKTRRSAEWKKRPAKEKQASGCRRMFLVVSCSNAVYALKRERTTEMRF